MKTIKEQDIGISERMERLLEDLLAVMNKLDLSIDYLASSVTGQDPFEIGLSQSALGRVVGKAGSRAQLKENKNMKITKLQLRNIIQEVLDEVEFAGETPAGQLYGTEEEDARFKQQLVWEKELKRAGLEREEMSVVFKALENPDAADDFYNTPAYEKLFGYYAFSEDGQEAAMPYGVAKARTGLPDEWILDYLHSLGSAPGGAAGAGSAMPMREKITKAELRTIVQEEFDAVIIEAGKVDC